MSGKDPIDLGAAIIRDLMTKKENEVLDKLESAAKNDPSDIPQIIDALFPDDINDATSRLDWLNKATLPVLESQLISTGFMEEDDLKDIANAAVKELEKETEIATDDSNGAENSVTEKEIETTVPGK